MESTITPLRESLKDTIVSMKRRVMNTAMEVEVVEKEFITTQDLLEAKKLATSTIFAKETIIP